jgi:hypothetical protein
MPASPSSDGIAGRNAGTAISMKEEQREWSTKHE